MGDIKWLWRDPKTVELYNTDRERKLMQQMLTAEARANDSGADASSAYGAFATANQALGLPVPQSMLTSGVTTDEERQKLADDLQHNQDESRFGPGARPGEQEKREWNAQIRQYDKYLRRDHGEHPEDGFSELVGTGAVWIGEDGGLWTNSGKLTQREIKSLSEGWKLWAQQLEHGDQFYRDDYAESLAKHQGWQQEVEDQVHGVYGQKVPRRW